MTDRKMKYMMATTAFHQLGDISRDEPDLCFIHDESDAYYIGNWVTGLGFINVQFPKKTTRELSQDEIKHYNKRHLQIGSQPPIKLKVD